MDRSYKHHVALESNHVVPKEVNVLKNLQPNYSTMVRERSVFQAQSNEASVTNGNYANIKMTMEKQGLLKPNSCYLIADVVYAATASADASSITLGPAGWASIVDQYSLSIRGLQVEELQPLTYDKIAKNAMIYRDANYEKEEGTFYGAGAVVGSVTAGNAGAKTYTHKIAVPLSVVSDFFNTSNLMPSAIFDNIDLQIKFRLPSRTVVKYTVESMTLTNIYVCGEFLHLDPAVENRLYSSLKSADAGLGVVIPVRAASIRTAVMGSSGQNSVVVKYPAKHLEQLTLYYRATANEDDVGYPTLNLIACNIQFNGSFKNGIDPVRGEDLRRLWLVNTRSLGLDSAQMSRTTLNKTNWEATGAVPSELASARHFLVHNFHHLPEYGNPMEGYLDTLDCSSGADFTITSTFSAADGTRSLRAMFEFYRFIVVKNNNLSVV